MKPTYKIPGGTTTITRIENSGGFPIVFARPIFMAVGKRYEFSIGDGEVSIFEDGVKIESVPFKSYYETSGDKPKPD